MPFPPSSQHSDPQWKMGCHPRGQPRITPLLRCLPPPPCPSPPPASATHTHRSSAIHPPRRVDTGPFTVVSRASCVSPPLRSHARTKTPVKSKPLDQRLETSRGMFDGRQREQLAFSVFLTLLLWSRRAVWGLCGRVTRVSCSVCGQGILT